MGWIIVGVVVVALVWLLLPRMRQVAAIFAPRHYVELAEGMQKVKAAALQNTRPDDEAPMTLQDPRALLTSAGLAVAYTVTHEESGWVHHYSLSVPGGVTPGAVGETFTVAVAVLLKVPIERLITAVSPKTVYHTEFTLSADEQSRFAARDINSLSLDDAATLHETCQQMRASLSIGAVEV